jgi:hypothetical protein
MDENNIPINDEALEAISAGGHKGPESFKAYMTAVATVLATGNYSPEERDSIMKQAADAFNNKP